MPKLKVVKIHFVSKPFFTSNFDDRQQYLFYDEFRKLNEKIRKISREEATTLLEKLHLLDARFLFDKDAVEDDFVRKEKEIGIDGRICVKKV